MVDFTFENNRIKCFVNSNKSNDVSIMFVDKHNDEVVNFTLSQMEFVELASKIDVVKNNFIIEDDCL